jgi:hypothetical protein
MEISGPDFQSSRSDDSANLLSEQRPAMHRVAAALSPVPLEAPPASGSVTVPSNGARVPDSVAGWLRCPVKIAGLESVVPGETTRILLVDDVPQNLNILEETLRPLGHTLLLASSGHQCLAGRWPRRTPVISSTATLNWPKDGLYASRLHEAWNDREARAWWRANLPHIMEP